MTGWQKDIWNLFSKVMSMMSQPNLLLCNCSMVNWGSVLEPDFLWDLKPSARWAWRGLPVFTGLQYPMDRSDVSLHNAKPSALKISTWIKAERSMNAKHHQTGGREVQGVSWLSSRLSTERQSPSLLQIRFGLWWQRKSRPASKRKYHAMSSGVTSQGHARQCDPPHRRLVEEPKP